jgi:hypothetical protein
MAIASYQSPWMIYDLRLFRKEIVNCQTYYLVL